MSNQTSGNSTKRPRRFLRWLCFLACGAALLLFGTWAGAALYYDLPLPSLRIPVLAAFGLIILLALTVLRPWRAALSLAAAFLVVLGWWFTLKPSNTRSWQPDVARTAWAEIRGDDVTLYNVRNCDYISETNFTPRWDTRTVRLSKMTGIDIALTYWGSPWMAHPIVSFQFADAPPVAISIETRKEIGESYSAIRGFFRQYELIYIVADERDVVRLRTNYRQGEEVYLYRTRATPEQARQRFLEYLTEINRLHARPTWYNALTANCTTSIRTQRDAAKRAPFDWRMIANGKSDEMAYERGAFAGNVPFADLKTRSLINSAAKAADKSPQFSRVIREGIPWFNPDQAPRP